MATLDHQSYMDKEENPAEKPDKVRILVVLGLESSDSKSQSICHINLDREDAINFIFTAPTEIPAESAACVHHNELYTVGVGLEFSELWRWSAERDDWKRLADLPSGRRRHCATCVGEKIYVLGGWVDADKRTLDSVLCYDINFNNCTEVSQLCFPVHSATCVTYKHFIYIFGGVDKDDENVNHVQVYDTSTGEVTLSSNSMPGAQRLMRAVLWRSKALLIGCWTCYIYDFELNSWEERNRFKTDVYQFGLTLNDDTLSISGGTSRNVNDYNETDWTCNDEVKSLPVDDFISDNQQAEWKHHNKILHPAVIHSYSEFGLERDISKHPSIGMTHVDVELNGEMRGMTVVDDRLFVVPSEDPVVNVYDAHSLRALYAIYIPDMKDPQDLTGCSHNEVLYISDGELKCIHKVIIAGGHLSKWNVRENYLPFYMSVTSEYNLLVSLYKQDREAVISLVEYTSDGHELREITLDSSLKTAWPAGELNQFIICYSSLHRPSLMNFEDKGNIRKSNMYIGRAGTVAYELKLLRSMTIDNKRELVFVADNDNSRVDMYNTDMSHICQIQKSALKSKPSRVYFDETSDRLYLDASTKRITENPRGAIRGLTVVDDQLFVVHERHKSQVHVYDSYSMEAMEPINIPDMKNPQGIAGRSHNKVLFISDEDLQCIHRVITSGGRLSLWKMRENYKLCGISVTSENNLLVTLQSLINESDDDFSFMSKNPTGKTINNRIVVEYTSEGHELREIKLDRSIEKTWQVVELNSNQFIICHDSFFPKLSVINAVGEIINSYNGQAGQGHDSIQLITFSSPAYSIAMDRKRDLVLLVDLIHNIVEIFSYTSDILHLGQVQTSRQFVKPTCAYIDTSSDRLFVGEMSGRVVICLMKRQLLELEKQLKK